MPTKPKKTQAEKLVENFFPVDEGFKFTTEKPVLASITKDELLKRAIEKPVLAKPIEKELPKMLVEKMHNPIEDQVVKNFEFLEESKKVAKTKMFPKENISKKPYSKKPYSKKSGSKSSKKNSKAEKFSPQKINLKENGYELIITEKPQAAMKIADALGKSKKESINGIPYYGVSRQGKEIYVACAVGHLFTLKQMSGAGFPIFDVAWIPNFLAKKKADFTKKYYDTISKLAKNAGSITVATDFDVEGEVIGLNVVRYICGQQDANRMKFSTLTKDELNKAYENKNNSLEWGQAIAGETRHYLDWFYGINLSRALMDAIKSTGKFRIMSIGRVQGPALNLIVQKEREILAFKPEDYWQVFISISDGKNQIELKYIEDIFEKAKLKQFEGLKGKKAIADTKKTQEYLPPNPPFNLTTLQTEAYKFFGLNPAKTLQIAQSLYLAGLISYPRTSSQKLPDSIAYKEILQKLAKDFNVQHLIKKQKPKEGEKTDPAHPSIYPTGEKQILSGDEEKIYNLISKRFLSLFCEDAIIENKKITAQVDGLKFATRGMEIQKKSWLEIYPSKMKEEQIPDFKGEVDIIDSRTEQKQTQPPRRYSPASIISELEKRNLGTKATRASILETLYDRGYVKGQSVEATPLGMSLIATLEKHSPIIIDEELTRNFETEMDSISELKTGFEKMEKKVVDEAKVTITKISNQFKKEREDIGKELVQANEDFREQQKIENALMQCPKCKQGDLAITYSKKNKKYFIACNKYPDCKTTFSLPPNGLMKKANQVCESCGFPKIMALKKGKKPWIFCFNRECETNKKRIEEYNKKKEEGL